MDSSLSVAEKADKIRAEEQFQSDSKKLGEYASSFVSTFYPSYLVNNDLAIASPQEERSLELLNSFTFYRICECSVCDVEDKVEFFAEKMKKLFTTAYAIKQEVCYGIVSNGDYTALVLGVQPKSDNEAIKVIIEGLLPGIKLEQYKGKMQNAKDSDGYDIDRFVGCISGIPALKIDDKYLRKDLSSLMRSLNGKKYTIMVLCKPVDEIDIQEKINAAISIKDNCYAISKRTIAIQSSSSSSSTHTNNYNESNGENKSRTSGTNMSGALPLAAVGATIGSIVPGVGTVVGAVGGGLIGLIVGKQLSFNSSKSKGTTHSITQGYSDAVTNAITQGESISGEIQNGFALELMKMADSVIDRLKIGRSIGMWSSVVTFSSDSEIASNIIKGSLYSEMASGLPDVLPPILFSYRDSCFDSNKKLLKAHTQHAMIPEGFFDGPCVSPLTSLVTSEELCGICTLPLDRTVGFEIRDERIFPLNYMISPEDIPIGAVCECDRPLQNTPFGFCDEDLNKHTFVCGITGSGKTTTVKAILSCTKKPFMVIEPAKREYRNINRAVTVYTLGRPEINCLRLNPFYVLPGISPQQHIDMLKDLFSASFAFYGPMPFIVEKCLYRVYSKKGWDLTLGFHPQLINSKSQEEFFDQEGMKRQYSISSHRFLFPTMQDLKDEVDYYIENEMTYEGEVKGNIRGAIKSRIDSLCVGAKGYMFNTPEMVDFEQLLESNTVLELEGLADDADKAFALGLLIIYVNEYRQIQKAVDQTQGLKHLLVLEEAHRLLKNSPANINADVGNPEGKAVEHFTNMLAEMRSYGQGVIVAEQIPTKIAPDVIKNTSNKIIHRIVSKDDQEVIASTVGISSEDAVAFGNLKNGYALCHKEGMNLPVTVRITEAKSNNILDKRLYDKDLGAKMFSINKSTIENHLSSELSVWATRFLVTMMCSGSQEDFYTGIETAIDSVAHQAALQMLPFIPGVDKRRCIIECLSDKIISLLISGVFSFNTLPPDSIVTLIRDSLDVPTKKRLSEVFEAMEKLYRKNPRKKAIETVASLLAQEFTEGLDVLEMASDFCLSDSTSFSEDVLSYLKGSVA